ADEIEPSEISVIHTAIGELDRQRTLNAVWRREGMGVLTWALGCTKLPRYDEGTSYGVVARQLGFLQARERTGLAFPLLRDLKEIMEGNETYFTLGWRLGEFASSRRPIDFAKSIEPSKRNSMTLTGIDIVDGDLAIGEDRVDRASKDRYEQTRSIV